MNKHKYNRQQYNIIDINIIDIIRILSSPSVIKIIVLFIAKIKSTHI